MRKVQFHALSQIGVPRLPGLHITQGSFVKIFDLLEYACKIT